MSRTGRWLMRLIGLGVVAAGTTSPIAQPSNHTPGTICMTPTFYCWNAGPVGTPCTCPSAQGLVSGTHA